DGFRPVLVAAPLHELVNFLGKLVLERDRDPLHQSTLPIGMRPPAGTPPPTSVASAMMRRRAAEASDERSRDDGGGRATREPATKFKRRAPTRDKGERRNSALHAVRKAAGSRGRTVASRNCHETFHETFNVHTQSGHLPNWSRQTTDHGAPPRP